MSRGEESATSSEFHSTGVHLKYPIIILTYERDIPDSTALISPFWISDRHHGGPEKVAFLRILDGSFYYEHFEIGEMDSLSIPRLLSLLKDYGTLVIESEDVISRPRPKVDDACYYKGIYMKWLSDELLEVGGVFVDHLGDTLAGTALMSGYYYRLLEGSITRSRQPEDCRCSDEVFHFQHLRVLREIEQGLSRGRLKKESTGTMYLVPRTEKL